jgi:hypothetical protein
MMMFFTSLARKSAMMEMSFIFLAGKEVTVVMGDIIYYLCWQNDAKIGNDGDKGGDDGDVIFRIGQEGL